MRSRRLTLLAVGLLAGLPSVALADPVVVLSESGHASVREDPFLTVPADPSPPGSRFAVTAGRRTVRGELARLRRRHEITDAAYRRFLRAYGSATRAAQRFGGTRRAELDAVIGNLQSIAARGSLTASRLPALLVTLDRNRRWWTTGPLLSPGARVEFAGSQLVWEYYAGQGIELQELGSFGKADGLYTAGRSHYGAMRQLLAEIIPLAARRAGGRTWEYYFGFGGGLPPWTSAMSQGTALEALTRAYKAFGAASYLRVAHRALPVLGAAPPRGVSVRTRRGRRFLLYSFAPGAKVINGFLQTLIGLYDYAHASGDRRAAALFRQGDAEARAEVPHYDTGSWSLYQPGVLDSIDYHKLVTGFLEELCSRTHARVYCRTAAHFRRYLRHPPPGV